MQKFLLLVAAGALSLATNADAKTMKVFNPTHYAVTAVQAKKPGAKEWDADVLGKKALGVGKVAQIDIATTGEGCKVDLRITFDDGHKVERQNVDICSTDILQVGDDDKPTN